MSQLQNKLENPTAKLEVSQFTVNVIVTSVLLVAFLSLIIQFNEL